MLIAGVTIDLDTTELARRFEHAAANLDHLDNAFARAADELVAAVRRRINAGIGKPLAPSTLAKPRVSSRALRRTDHFYSTLKAVSAQGMATAASDVPYIVFHLEGGRRIPKRNPFELSSKAVEPIEAKIVAAMAQLIAGGGNP